MKAHKNAKISGILAGVAGEYFVAAELSRRGLICSVTLKNTKGIDILVTTESATRNLGIQVKSNQGSKPAWVLNSKAEDFIADELFYVFVNLSGVGHLPEFYIVPGKVVANTVKSGHRAWLDTPGKRGNLHNDNPIRQFSDHERKYLDKWELLEFQLNCLSPILTKN